MDKLVNEKLIDVQEHVEQELLFIIKEFTGFLNISLISVELVDKFTQTEVAYHNNEKAIDSGETLSDPENFSDNKNVSQVILKVILADDTLAQNERLTSNLQLEPLYLREYLKSRNTYLSEEILYLRVQLQSCLHRMLLKCDDTNFLSYINNLNSPQKISNISISVPPGESNSSEHNNVNNNCLTVNVNKEKESSNVNNNWSGNENPVKFENKVSTVKLVYNGYLRFLKKVSATTSCPLYRVLDFFEQKKTTEIKM